MTTASFKFIDLGLAPDMDVTEDYTNTAERVLSVLGGKTFGSSGNPLYSHSYWATLNDTSGNNSVAMNEYGTSESIRYTLNGIAYDVRPDSGVVVRNVSVVQALPGGTTRTITTTVRIVQGENGQLSLMPPLRPLTYANEAALTEYPIVSLKLPTSSSDYVTGFRGVDISRAVFADFPDGYVDGTAGNDRIDAAYTGDRDGDRVDNADAWLPGTTGDADHIRAGDGNDTVMAGAANDTVEGGSGNDLIDGGAGDDRLFGDAGSDTLTGGAGNDTLDGGDGDDRLLVGAGDTARGGSGDDDFVLTPGAAGSGPITITGGETGEDLSDPTNNADDGGRPGDRLDASAIGTGATLTYSGAEAGSLTGGGLSASFSEIERVELGAGADTVNAAAVTAGGINVATGAGADQITGGAGADRIEAGEGDDIVDGGAGSDTIDGGAGADRLSGGTGSDSILAGAGADTITGGAGNDIIDLGPADGAIDVIVLGNGSGADTVRGFTAPIDSDGDGIVDRTGDRLDVSALADAPGRDGQIRVGDFLGRNPSGTIADVVQNGQAGVLFTFPNGETTFLPGLSRQQFDSARKLTLAGIPCFAAGTRIATPAGEVAVESLRPGDRVWTRDSGPLALRWVGKRHLTAAELRQSPRFRPVLIRRGALGPNAPARDLLVSPQHRVLVRSRIAVRMFGAAEVLVAARHLCGLPGIEVVMPDAGLTYVHILFDRHEIVMSNGAETESLFPGAEAMRAVGPAAAEEILALFPELRDPGALFAPARIFCAGPMARRLADRHARNRQPMLT